MVKIVGSVERSFLFPADLPMAFNFYSDMHRILHFLPHISLLRRYNDGKYRMQYASTELGVYRVRIICDLETVLDAQAWKIRIQPMKAGHPVSSEASLYSLTGQGNYASESSFYPQGSQTRVDYCLKLCARLPLPLAVRFMPTSVVQNIAQNIAQRRIQEIAEGFIERSIRAYQP